MRDSATYEHNAALSPFQTCEAVLPMDTVSRCVACSIRAWVLAAICCHSGVLNDLALLPMQVWNHAMAIDERVCISLTTLVSEELDTTTRPEAELSDAAELLACEGVIDHLADYVERPVAAMVRSQPAFNARLALHGAGSVPDTFTAALALHPQPHLGCR